MSRYAVFGGSVNTEGAAKPIQHLFRPGYATGFAVSQRGAGANMSVDVAAGGALHVTTASVAYYGYSDATENVTGFTADASNPKRVIIVSYIDLSLITTSSVNNADALNFMAISGTAAASPSDPSDSVIQTAVGAGNPFNKLARIAVGAAASSIVNANITDLRTPMALSVPYLYGGSSNTNGHLVPNVADDTVTLLNATQTLTNKTINGSQLIDFSVSSSKLPATDGVLRNIQYFTASATWTKPSGLKFAIVEVQGGGGAGGGTPATNASTYSVGGGGGAGCYARKKSPAADLSSTETVTVGAGGAGASGTTGGSGGSSSFGSHCTAGGGTGGSSGSAANTAGAVVNGGSGSSTGTGGDLIIPGEPGSWGFVQANNNNVGGGGKGGNSVLGRGGKADAANTTGAPGNGYGAGGGGSCRAFSQGATTGGAGATGIVIVYEYF